MGTSELEFSDADKALLSAWLSALESIQDRMSLPQLTTLLTIALHPGLSVNEVAEKTSIPQQSASRYVAMLLGRYETLGAPQPQWPLIDQTVNLEDPRRRALF